MAVPESAKEDVKIILNGFYGHDFADRININKKVVEVVSEMILSAESCSRSIDLVPRPAGVKPALAWVFRQLANMARRVVNNDGVYIMCKNEVARQYRRHIEQASMGF